MPASPNNNPTPSEDFELPSNLVEALRRHDAPTIEIPGAIDAAILASARRLISHRRKLRTWRRIGAVAACLLAAVVLWQVQTPESSPTQSLTRAPTQTDSLTPQTRMARDSATREARDSDNQIATVRKELSDSLVAVAPPAPREDFDASGRVDILDAFWLARRLESGAVVDARWDLTGDGHVNQSDVDAAARLAVLLAQISKPDHRAGLDDPLQRAALMVGLVMLNSTTIDPAWPAENRHGSVECNNPGGVEFSSRG